MLRTLRADVVSAFSRRSIVENAAWLLLIAAGNLVWPTVAATATGLTWRSLIPLGIAGFLSISATFLVLRERASRVPPRLTVIARQVGTELRDIRHKIEIVRSTRPRPHYSHGFRLPAARWAEFDDEIAVNPDLYRTVERAYTAAHHVNEALEMRRTRATPNATIGVIPDDGLDEAYEAAGDALDALNEERGEVWEPRADRAVRRVVEDVMKETEARE